jgi:CheY-like chemotaxis protein
VTPHQEAGVGVFAWVAIGVMAVIMAIALVWVVVLRTRLRRQTEELLDARRMVESANRAKSELVATLSREIRTPLNGILGMSELVLETELQPLQREHLEMVKTSAENLLAIVDGGVAAPKAESAAHDGDRCHEPTSRLRVLLAEDNVINQRLAAVLLTRDGHHVTIVGNGREAVAAGAYGQFDAIFMDVQMAEMDGLEATAAIRAVEEGSGTRIPIVAMTAHAMDGDRERCLTAGMDDYISKPVSRSELRRVLSTPAPRVLERVPEMPVR